jgi:uncharacterized protein (TIGR02391 family)
MKGRLAGIEYVGIAGVSAACKDAVIRLLQYGTRVTLGRILSHSNHHCLLLTVESGDLVAVKSGFASGYSGEGPRTFSFVLELLDSHGADLEEYAVDEGLLDRLDLSALTRRDILCIDAARPIRPNRWADYVIDDDWDKSEDGTLWREFRPIIPFAIVDPRIIDLALKFEKQPDDCLLKGYRRLEDYVRERTGIDEHGAKLFSQAFQSRPPKLTWKDIDDSEQAGRASLFTGAFMAYRNPRAHREPKEHSSELAEFLLLNHLFMLENEAVDQHRKRRKPESRWDTLRKEVSSSKWKRPRERKHKRQTTISGK